MRSPSNASHPSRQVIHIQPLAPSKPLLGAACNGCGVCCLAEPCPLGVLLSRSRSGPCKALQWDPGDSRYRCGALGTGLRARLVGRWIAAGAGCDCDLEASPSVTMEPPSLPAQTPANRHD